MADILLPLVGLGVILAIITVVGHGIWLLLTAIFGRRRPTPPPAISGGHAGRRSCPRCSAPLTAPQLLCPVCSWPHTGSWHADRAAALEALAQQLARFAEIGAVDPQTRAAIMSVVEAEQQRLTAAEKLRREAEQPLVELAAETSVEATIAAEALAVRPQSDSAEPAMPPPVAAPLIPPREPPAPPAERVRTYAARREAAAAEIQDTTAPVVLPSAKRREAVGRLLAAFMEEKNIRWGELVGGLLIVGSSIALVLSFWSEIAARPLLKFFLFNGVTAALFGVGLYTDRRWKIHTTSHGVLVIATLLVPLNFLAIAAFTRGSPPAAFASTAGEVVSLLVFALLVHLAGRIVTPTAAWLLVAGVMVPSLVQLLVRRFAEPAPPLAWQYVLAGVPIAVYVATTTMLLRACADTPRSQWEKGVSVLTFLGIVSAATLLPLALLVYLLPPLDLTLHRLSPLVVPCGLPGLLVGLLFWRRPGELAAAGGLPGGLASASGIEPDRVPDAVGRRLSGVQTAGIFAGVLGAMIMTSAIVLAWPEPATLLPVALAGVVVFTVVALWFDIRAAHVPAGVALAGAWLVAFHLAWGNVTWTLESYEPVQSALVSATSGHALVPLVGLLGAIIWLLRRLGRQEDGRMVALVAGATAVASLALVMWFGLGRIGDPAGAVWTLAIYALAALVGAVMLDRPVVAWTGTVLLLVTLIQAVVYRLGPEWQLERPWIMALLTHATLAVISFGSLRSWPYGRHVRLRQVLSQSALATSLAAIALVGAVSAATHASTLAVDLGWLSVVWLALAALAGWPALFTASQVTLVLTIVCGVTAAVETRPWYAAARHPWLDPWFLEAQGIALAAYCLVRDAVRWLFERFAEKRAEFVVEPPAPNWFVTGGRLLSPPWPAVDHVIEVALVVLVMLLATYAVVPGAAQELAPLEAVRGAGPAVRVVPPAAQWEIAGIDHLHAAGRGAWLLLTAVGLTLLAGLWQLRAWRRLGGMLILAAAVCPLLAAQWEPDVATASVLRWLVAGYFLLASIPIWLRHRLPAAFWEWVGREESVAAAYGWTSTGSDLALAARSRVRSAGSSWAGELPVEKGSRSLGPPLGLPSHDAGRNLLVALVVLVYVAMGAYVTQAVLVRAGLPVQLDWLLPYVLVWALVAGGVGLAVRWTAEGGMRDFEGRLTGRRRPWVRHTRDVLWVLAAAPLVVLLTFAVAAALRQYPLVGPDPASWFRRIGWDASYGVPLAVVALVLVGHAIHDRSSRFAFSAGLLLNLVATIVVLVRLAAGGGALDAAAWITVTQVNAIVSAAAALVWLAAISWGSHLAAPLATQDGSGRGASSPLLLVTQVALAAALCATFLAPAVGKLVVEPDSLTWVLAAGGAPGWIALALTVAAAVWMSWRRTVSQAGVAAFVAMLAAIVALTAGRWDAGNWLAYRTLLVACCAAAWLVPVATVAARRLLLDSAAGAEFPRWSAISVRLFAVAAVLLALGAVEPPAPGRPWWTIGALVAIGARNVWIAWHEARRGFMWIAALLAILAVDYWWADSGYKLIAATGMGGGSEFLWVNVLAAGMMAIVSVWVENRRIQPLTFSAGPRPGWRLGWHRFAAWVIVLAMLLTTGVALAADVIGEAFSAYMPLGWAAWAAALVAAVACWWDPATRWPVACLYCVGLLAVGLYLDGLNFRGDMFWWALAMALGAYSLASSYLWSRRDALRWYAARFGAPVEPPPTVEATDLALTARPGDGHGWLVSANSLLTLAVLALVFWSETVIGDFSQRMIAAYAVGAQGLALGMLARGIVRSPLKYTALVFGVLFAVAFGWAWLPPTYPAPWLHRTVVSVVGLAAMIIVYGFGLVKFLKRRNDWTDAAERLVPLLAVVATVLVMLVMGIETVTYLDAGEVPIAWPALVAVLVALVGLAAAALVAALVPGRDPLGLSERGRTVYVYAAEAIVALACLHVRLTMPWLFSGWWMQFWPLLVMAIAFAGVGAGEIFDRRRQRVLAEPLHTTGALLPLLPALGFWAMSSQVHYSLLLLSVGVLYAAMSVMRRSLLFAVLAALAANGSLWYLLHTREGLGLLEHPQLWLIPPALCLLVAGHLNRQRLSAEQSAALRYASAIAIYVSSTADVFIAGVAEAPWLPAVLAGLSILGAFAGILLRVRAFLYLGTAFLVVALATVIWYAAIEQQRTWILWVVGIITGALIIALFGLFEKRRDDVLRVVDQLKQWEA